MRFTAKGLKPILDAYFPKLMALAQGNFVPVVDGVAVELPAESEVNVLDDGGNVLFQFPGGIRIHISKHVGPLGIIPVNATETVTAVNADATGLDVSLSGWRSPIRLEAAP